MTLPLSLYQRQAGSKESNVVWDPWSTNKTQKGYKGGKEISKCKNDKGHACLGTQPSTENFPHCLLK